MSTSNTRTNAAESHNHHPELTANLTEAELGDWKRADEGDDAASSADANTTEALGSSTHGHRAVAQALTQRGVREAAGANGGVPLERYVRYFIPRSGAEPWCAFFVSWCFDTTGDKNRRMPWPYPGSVASIHQWASAHGRVVTSPQHGDIFGIGSEHTGLVAGADPTTIWTIEGNYGAMVAQRGIRYRNAGLWFARL